MSNMKLQNVLAVGVTGFLLGCDGGVPEGFVQSDISLSGELTTIPADAEMTEMIDVVSTVNLIDRPLSEGLAVELNVSDSDCPEYTPVEYLRVVEDCLP